LRLGEQTGWAHSQLAVPSRHLGGTLMFSSIRGRLTLSHLAVIVVAMGLSGFVLLSLMEGYFLQAMEDSLVAQARITAQALIPGAMAGGPPIEVPSSAYNALQQQQASNISLQAENVAPPVAEIPLSDFDLNYLTDASLQLSSQLDTRIRILDAQGVVLVDSLQQDGGANLGSDPVVAQALTGQYASRTDPGGQGSAMHLAVPVLVDGKLVGAVYLSQPLRDVAAVVRDLRTRWLVSTLVALLLAGGIGFLLSRAIARPLHRLTAAASAVARGQFDQQVPVGSRDELGRLSQTFNEMTSRLRAARQMQVDFVANVSHELRTPLTAVKGTIETLRDGAVDDAEVRDRFLETVEEETDRLIRLVNDLLVLSRADSEALNLHLEPVELGELARSTVTKLAARAEARDVALLVASSRCWSICWTMRSSTRGQEAPCRSVWIPTLTERCGSRSATRGSASRRPNCRASASAFTGPTGPAPEPRVEVAWGWPSPRYWWKPTAAGCGWRVRRGRGRR
jgi:HAMP domain-containing protein